MIIIKPEVKHIPYTERGKVIEYAGRVCYKSQDSITEDSHEKFISHIAKRGHTSVLEHEQIIVNRAYHQYTNYMKYFYSAPVGGQWIMSGNVRAWHDLIKNGLGDKSLLNGYAKNDLVRINNEALHSAYPYIFPQIGIDYQENEIGEEDDDEVASITVENYKILDDFTSKIYDWDSYDNLKHFTFEITTNRSISHQIVRHRTLSFSQESQRYINYSLGKFGSEIKYCIPEKYIENETFMHSLSGAQSSYFSLLKQGLKPEEARHVLPNATATTIIATGSLKDWKHFIDLRDDSHAQPEIQEIAKEIEKIIGKEIEKDFMNSTDLFIKKSKTTQIGEPNNPLVRRLNRLGIRPAVEDPVAN